MRGLRTSAEKILDNIYAFFIFIITASIGMAVFSGLLNIFNALLISILLDIAFVAISYYLEYRMRVREEKPSEILLSYIFLDDVLLLFLYQWTIIFPMIIPLLISTKGSPFHVILLAPLGTIAWIYLTTKFPLFSFLTKIEPLDYQVPYKVYVAKYERAGKFKEKLEKANANALVSGIIRPKIILLPSLFEFLNEDEIRGVIAHEIGHIVHKDHLKSLFPITVNIISVEFLALFFYYSYVVGDDKVGSLFFMLGMLLSVIPFFFSFYVRRMELKADLYAARAVGKDTYISALRKLHEYGIPRDWSGDHPPLEKRIDYVLKN
jgi:STE24 endopeptidase